MTGRADIVYLNIMSYDDTELGARVRDAYAKGQELRLGAAGRQVRDVDMPCEKHDVADDDCATCGDEQEDGPPSIESLYQRIEKIALECAENSAHGEEAARWIDAARQAHQGAQEAMRSAT